MHSKCARVRIGEPKSQNPFRRRHVSILYFLFSTSFKSSQSRWIQHETVVRDHSKKTPWDDLKMRTPRQNAAWDDSKPKTMPRNPAGEKIPSASIPIREIREIRG
jgi:hypothetical protein